MNLAWGIRRERDHRWVQRRASDYVDGELSRRQRRRLEAHATLCPECGPMVRVLTVLLWELRELGRRQAPVSVAPGVVERLRQDG
jgi:hypothetical protein